ncbi:MAG: asparaginase domain-containing protein [Cloacibacillus sp.]
MKNIKANAEGEVLVISTGGTIVSVDHGFGAEPDAAAAHAVLGSAAACFAARGLRCCTDFIFGEAGRDSSDIGPKEWAAISAKINDAAAHGVKKILVIHGTDTMAFTAAWLALAAPGAAVVLTGSQRTPEASDFDGDSNLRGAAELLCSIDEGVFIHFAGKNFRAPYVHKENSSELDAYTQSCGARALPEAPRSLLDAAAKVGSVPSEELLLLHVYPGVAPRFDGASKIVLLEGYGAGNMPQRLHEAFAAAYAAQKPVVIAASSCVHGAKAPGLYAGVGIAGLAAKNFTVFSQGSYSLEFLIALSYLALAAEPSAPEKVLELYLEKF